MSGKSDVGAWMKFYPSDWLAGTRMLSPLARAALIDLLAYAWDHGSIPGDPRMLARFCAMTLDEFPWDELRDLWETSEDPDGGRTVLVNPKQEKVRREQTAARDRKRRQRDRGRDNGRDESVTPPETNAGGSGLRAQDSGNRVQGAGLQGPEGAASQPPGQRRRVDGKAELAKAVELWEAEHGPMRSDLLEAMGEYRASRVENRKSCWRVKSWMGALDRGSRDQVALIEAFRLAAESGWASVHPKTRRNGQLRDRGAEARAVLAETMGRLIDEG